MDTTARYTRVATGMIAKIESPLDLLSKSGKKPKTGKKPNTSRYPSDARWQRDLSVAFDKIGDVLRRQGKLADALASYNTAFAIRDRLAKADPENAGSQLDLAMVEYRLAGVQAETGNKTEALRLLQAGREILAPLVERSKNPIWQKYLQYFDADIAALNK